MTVTSRPGRAGYDQRAALAQEQEAGHRRDILVCCGGRLLGRPEVLRSSSRRPRCKPRPEEGQGGNGGPRPEPGAPPKEGSGVGGEGPGPPTGSAPR